MTEIDALKEQIELLKKLVSSQEQLIAEMRKNTTWPVVSIPSIWTTPCQHEYPNPWFGTVQPNCKKCGQQASGTITVYGGAQGGTIQSFVGDTTVDTGGSFGVTTGVRTYRS